MKKLTSDLTEFCFCKIAPPFVVVLGLAVMLGWILNVQLLMSVVPGAVAMQFNTALCFVFVASGIIMITKQGLAPASLVAFPAAMIAFLTMFQYRTGIEIGIDSLFWDHQYAENTSAPGRMAPNTALAFVAVFFAILYRDRIKLMRFLAGAVFFMGLSSVVGYVLDLPNLYNWGKQFTDMAVHTGLGFTALSGSLLICSFPKVREAIHHGRLFGDGAGIFKRFMMKSVAIGLSVAMVASVYSCSAYGREFCYFDLSLKQLTELNVA